MVFWPQAKFLDIPKFLDILGVVVALALTGAVPAAADTYPSRPVTIVTPFAAGSQTDAAARVVAQQFQEMLGQSFVIENKAGAGGVIAATVGGRSSEGKQPRTRTNRVERVSWSSADCTLGSTMLPWKSR